jgi:ribonuclease HI
LQKKEITIYTDGACFGNPGPGGYAAVLKSGSLVKEISGGFRLTTNNRMEILAVIQALKALKDTSNYNITLFTDSRLVVNAINSTWIEKWKKNNWKRNAKDPVLNPDLWAELDSLWKEHNIKIEWVEGHAGNPGNERCDVLSKNAAKDSDLAIDLNYENTFNNKSFKL